MRILIGMYYMVMSNTGLLVDNLYCHLIPGHSGDSTHDSSQEGKCGDCQETDPPWSQCQPHEQGKSGLIQGVCTRVWQED